MEQRKMLRFTWRSNFWRLAAIFVIFLIGLQTVQPKKIAHDSDIVFDESPLDASEDQHSHHKRSIDEFDNNDEHWLWSNVNRIKRSIDKAFGNEENETPSENRVKRDWFDFWYPEPSNDGKENKTTTESTAMKENHDDEESTTDDDNDIYDGSGYTKFEETQTQTTLERFFRLKFKVSEIWSPDYESSNTQAYKTKAKEIERKLEHLYDSRKPVKSKNHIRTHVIRILRPSQKEIFMIGVTVEIISDEPITLDELEQIIGSALDSRKIENLSVERDSYYELTAIGVKPSNHKLKRSIRSINETTTEILASTTLYPKDDNTDDNENIFDDKDLFPEDDELFSSDCDDVEFECKSDHKCILLDSWCDGTADCDDNSDELSCATTPAIHFSIINETTTELTTSTTKSTSVSSINTTVQQETNTTKETTSRPAISIENNLNTTTITMRVSTEDSETTTTVKVLCMVISRVMKRQQQ